MAIVGWLGSRMNKAAVSAKRSDLTVQTVNSGNEGDKGISSDIWPLSKCRHNNDWTEQPFVVESMFARESLPY